MVYSCYDAKLLEITKSNLEVTSSNSRSCAQNLDDFEISGESLRFRDRDLEHKADEFNPRLRDLEHNADKFIPRARDLELNADELNP